MAKKNSFDVPEWTIDNAYATGGKGWCKISKAPLLYSGTDVVINIADIDPKNATFENLLMYSNIGGLEKALNALKNKFEGESKLLCGKNYPGHLELLRKMYLYKKSRPMVATLFVSSKDVLEHDRNGTMFNLYTCLGKVFDVCFQNDWTLGFKEGCAKDDLFNRISDYDFWQAICSANYTCDSSVKVFIAKG